MTATAFCDCCGDEVPRDQIATVTAYGIETAACCACRGVEPAETAVRLAGGWCRDEDVDGSPYWWRPGTEHDAITLHDKGDGSEFGIVVASSVAEAIRVDIETFGRSALEWPVETAAKICPVSRGPFMTGGRE